MLQMSVDLTKENGFTGKKTRTRQFSETMNDADYTDTPAQAKSLNKQQEALASM